jgi:hypothetical protein
MIQLVLQLSFELRSFSVILTPLVYINHIITLGFLSLNWKRTKRTTLFFFRVHQGSHRGQPDRSQRRQGRVQHLRRAQAQGRLVQGLPSAEGDPQGSGSPLSSPDLHPLLRGLHHQGRGPVHRDGLQHLRLDLLLRHRQDS